MDVPDLGGRGLGLGTVLLIAAAVLIGAPLLERAMESDQERAQKIVDIREARRARGEPV